MPYSPFISPDVADREDPTPFIVALEQRDRKPGGYFRPHARLIVTKTLRTGGLWQTLPAEECKTLILMLTFLTSNGSIQPALQQLAPAMQASLQKARARMQRLAQCSWRGKPLVMEHQRESGLDTWTLAPGLIEVQEAAQPEPVVPLFAKTAGREAVIARSRAVYSRSRAEAEAMVAEQLGHAPEELDDSPEGEARRQLRALGVSRDQVEALLTHHTASECLRQLAWLPYRTPKNPARLIVAAIEGRYDPPVPVLRELQVVAAEGSEASPVEQATDKVTQGNDAQGGGHV